MTFTFEVTDELLPSVELFLNSRVRTERDPLTGSTVVIRDPGHESPEALFNHHLNDALAQIVRQYPTGAIRTKMEAAQALQDEVKRMAVASPVREAKVR